MFKYFKDCKDLSDVKKVYKRLCMEFHPDLNKAPDACKIMQEINAEYAKVFEFFQNPEGNGDTAEDPSTFQQIINSLIVIPFINIELIGCWLWVSGDTKSVKDKLKELGLRYSKNKRAWYLAGSICKSSRKRLSLDDIRGMHGSKMLNEKKYLTA